LDAATAQSELPLPSGVPASCLPAGVTPPAWEEKILSAPVDAPDLELLRTFEPVVRFTKGEQFYPADVRRYVSQASLWARYPDGREERLVPTGRLDIDRLAESHEYPFGTIEFLRFNDFMGVAESARVLTEVARQRRESGNVFRYGRGRLARGGFLPRIFDAVFSISFFLRGKVSPVTAAAAELDYEQALRDDERYVYYGRVARQGGWTILQYWFFYYYNSWRSGFHGVNDHESDWENVIVYLYEDQGRLHPEWVAYASHDFQGDDLRRRWDDRGELDLLEGHPVVWAGAGSHASYFRQGEYQSPVEIPVPSWMRSLARGFSSFWTKTLGQAGRVRDPFRIPFVDFARGDGKSVGPGQEHRWDPVVIDESTPWVSRYRGLWGLYANDPISGENAPAGPMYNRDGSPRQSWYDPLGFAGLDKEPPPPEAIRLLDKNCSRIERRQEELQRLIAERQVELQALGVEMRGLEGNPHLVSRHQELLERSAELQAELGGLRKESSENEAVVAALRQKLTLLQAGRKPDPRAHIHKLGRPVAPREVRFNRTAEAWGAVSLSVILLGTVAILVLARGYIWIGLLVMVLAFIVIESILRAEYARTITGIASILAVVTAILLIGHYWLWIIIVLLASLAVFLLVQKIREL
jgi:hypothetical protein